MAQTVERCDQAIREGQQIQHMSINAAKLVSLRSDPFMRGVVASSELVNADGQSVVWASRLLGDPLPERVAGIDLMHELLTLAEQRGHGIFVLGARQEVLNKALKVIRRRHPELKISGSHHGYFVDADDSKIVDYIKSTRPAILFVAMTSPRKEHWTGRYRDELQVPLVMGVGGSIDVIAGVTRRAPRAWQSLGLEWAYRMFQEPQRMFKRYARTNTQFAMMVAMAALRRAAKLQLR